MIWSDPWIDVATTSPTEGTGVSPFCTTLPPPRPTLPPDLRFQCDMESVISDTDLLEWRQLVGTRWDVPTLRQRLASAWIARLWLTDGKLVATCVLRRGSAAAMWILETLVAQPKGRGYATALVRSVMTWIYETGQRGPFVLAYTWELSVAQLVVAWWCGWLKSAASYENGWIWTASAGECKFCEKTNTDHPVGPAMPMVFRDERSEVIVSDSGRGDGIGYVLACRGDFVDWAAIVRQGGWRALWWRGASAPARTAVTGVGTWQQTGEVVVVGLLNYDGRGSIPTRWITTEIAPESAR